MTKGHDLWDERAQAEQAAAGRPRRTVAVALEYDPAVAGAPKVTATGKGFVADQILQFAFAHGVKVRTDPDLAEVLAAVELDTIIPVEAFVAVAEILAYVYRANGRPPPETGGASL
jgi:flagellar biosynthesis protein